MGLERYGCDICSYCCAPCPNRVRTAPRHPPPRYNYKLALAVVVDDMNHTQIVMQALLANEQHESFVFFFEAFKELIYDSSPQVKLLPVLSTGR